MREEPLRSTRERSMSLPAALRFNREIAQFAKQKQFDLAILCYKPMLATRIAPDVVTYNTMINVYVKMQRLEDAFALFEQMKSEAIDPTTIVTYTSLVDGCGKSGSFSMAMALYHEVTASPIEPNMHFLTR